MPTEKKIKKKFIPWKHREHLFTPENITRYEKECCKDCIYRKLSCHMTVRAQRPGPVIWIVKDGKPVDLRKEMKENGTN